MFQETPSLQNNGTASCSTHCEEFLAHELIPMSMPETTALPVDPFPMYVSEKKLTRLMTVSCDVPDVVRARIQCIDICGGDHSVVALGFVCG